jgi:hypothetical protein
MGEQEAKLVSGVGSYSSYVTPILRKRSLEERVKLFEREDKQRGPTVTVRVDSS